MLTAQYLFLSTILRFALSSPVFSNLVVHEQRNAIPDIFVKSGLAPADQVLELHLGLVQGDMATLEERLYAVSTPGSPEYGHHLSKDEVEAFVRPAAESTTLVNQWLFANDLNASVISPAGDWLAVSMPVSQASSLFDAEFSVFTHQQSGKDIVRTLAYSIPAELSGHLDFVHPTITFDNPVTRSPVFPSLNTPSDKRNVAESLKKRAVPSSCSQTITPTCLQDLYGIPSAPAALSSIAPECNEIGVFGFDQQFANQADLTMFLKEFRPDIPSNKNTTFSLLTLDGGENPQTPRSDAGVLANLDIQFTIGLATNISTTFISVGPNNQDGPLEGLLDSVKFLLAMQNPPHVVVISSILDENTLSTSVASTLCSAIMQLGARGTSVIFPSGDGGVAGTEAETCSIFVPTFPSTCPFVTSVGATQEFSPEVAAPFSAGGFSNLFTPASHQTSAIAAYLAKLGNTDKGDFTPTGRAFPDVSAQGVNFEIVVDGELGAVAGTPASAAVFASVISLINDQVIIAGGNPLGFLNPFLYTTGASAFNDIVSGDNPGCNTQGFPALTGWDPVTGLGTPNFVKLLAAAKSLI